MIPGIVAGQMPYPGGGGGTPGAWNPADVTMGSGTFTFTNSDATVDNDSGQAGSVRCTTNKTGAGNKRYVEIIVDDYGTNPILGLAVGFWNASSTLRSDWSNASNLNATWNPDGTRYTFGQTNTDSTNDSDVDYGLSLVNGDVLGLRIEVGTGWDVSLNNGAWRPGPAFTESDVRVFATLGDGNFGDIGDNFMLTILTTAATQTYAAPSGYTAWDD